MPLVPQFSRMQHQTIFGAGKTFSLPPTEDFTLSGTLSWNSDGSNLCDSEIGVNYDDNKAYIRIGDNINELSYSGSTFSGNNLEQTLAIGNTTGTEDIVLSNGTQLLGEDGQSLVFNMGGFPTAYLGVSQPASQIFIDNQSMSGIQLTDTQITAGIVHGAGINITGNTSINLDSNNGGGASIMLTDVDVNTTVLSSVVDVVRNISGTFSTTHNEEFGVIINSPGSQINAGVINTVVIGGKNIIADEQSFVYVPNLNVESQGVIKTNNGGGQIDLDYFGAPDEVNISTDNGNNNQAYLTLTEFNSILHHRQVVGPKTYNTDITLQAGNLTNNVTDGIQSSNMNINPDYLDLVSSDGSLSSQLRIGTQSIFIESVGGSRIDLYPGGYELSVDEVPGFRHQLSMFNGDIQLGSTHNTGGSTQYVNGIEIKQNIDSDVRSFNLNTGYSGVFINTVNSTASQLIPYSVLIGGKNNLVGSTSSVVMGEGNSDTNGGINLIGGSGNIVTNALSNLVSGALNIVNGQSGFLFGNVISGINNNISRSSTTNNISGSNNIVEDLSDSNVSGNANTILGGSYNNISGILHNIYNVNSSIVGGYKAGLTSSNYNLTMGYLNNFGASFFGQYGSHLCSIQTTNAGPGGGGGTTDTGNNLYIPVNSSYSLDILGVAVVKTTGSSGAVVGDTFKFTGTVIAKNIAGTTTLVGSGVLTGTGDTSIAVSATVVADNATDTVLVRVTPSNAGTATINWSFQIRYTSVLQ